MVVVIFEPGVALEATSGSLVFRSPAEWVVDDQSLGAPAVLVFAFPGSAVEPGRSVAVGAKLAEVEFAHAAESIGRWRLPQIRKINPKSLAIGVDSIRSYGNLVRVGSAGVATRTKTS